MSSERTDTPTYPEHEKMLTLEAERMAVGAFLEWLDEQGIVLAQHTDEPGYTRLLMPLHQPIAVTMAQHFGIDLQVIEDEKRAMLASIRAAA